MIRFGQNARRGLASPTSNPAALGDPFTIAFGLVGSLTARAGFIARSPQDLPDSSREFYAKFVANYFAVMTTWYEHLRVGAVAGEVFQAAQAKHDATLYDFALNPGHYIHLDEWVHSPFAAASPIRLQSGMALQMDIIPVSKGPFCLTNGEDGVVLAEAALRSALAQKFPACWNRIQARREFMAGTLGIRLHESVLPLSNMPACLAPYGMAPEQVLVNK
jgi:hypothetical protein